MPQARARRGLGRGRRIILPPLSDTPRRSPGASPRSPFSAAASARLNGISPGARVAASVRNGSATRILIVGSVRNRHREPGPAAGQRPNLETPAQRLRPFSHRDDAEGGLVGGTHLAGETDAV